MISMNAEQLLVRRRPFDDGISYTTFMSMHAQLLIIQLYAHNNEANDNDKGNFVNG